MSKAVITCLKILSLPIIGLVCFGTVFVSVIRELIE